MAKRNMFLELSLIEKVCFAVCMAASLSFLTVIFDDNHEFLGTALMVMLIFHATFNRTEDYSTGSVGEVIKGVFALLFLLCVVTGLMIAKGFIALPSFGLAKEALICHKITACWCILLAGVHTGLHQKVFVTMFGRFKNLYKGFAGLVALIALYGVYAFATGNFIARSVGLGKTTSGLGFGEVFSIFVLAAFLSAFYAMHKDKK